MPLLQLDMNVFLKHYWQILKQFKIKLLLRDKEQIFLNLVNLFLLHMLTFCFSVGGFIH